jgi:preprotein translocase subunit YajC
MGQFLGPETDTFRQLLVIIVFSTIRANRKRKKQFEQALDYVPVQ